MCSLTALNNWRDTDSKFVTSIFPMSTPFPTLLFLLFTLPPTKSWVFYTQSYPTLSFSAAHTLSHYPDSVKQNVLEIYQTKTV